MRSKNGLIFGVINVSRQLNFKRTKCLQYANHTYRSLEILVRISATAVTTIRILILLLFSYCIVSICDS